MHPFIPPRWLIVLLSLEGQNLQECQILYLAGFTWESPKHSLPPLMHPFIPAGWPFFLLSLEGQNPQEG